MFTQTHLETILANLNEAIIVVEKMGTVTLANARCLWLLDIQPDDIQNQSLLTLIDVPESTLSAKMGFENDALFMLLQEMKADVWQTDSRFHEYKVQYPVRRHIRRKQIPLTDADGNRTGLAFFFSDFTEARDLRQKHDEITSMIVHDLRSPLTAVTASMRLLRELAMEEESSLGNIVFRTTEISSRAVRRLLHLVNSLLDVSKLENGMIHLEREPVNLADLIASVYDELKPMADEMEVQLFAEIPRDTPPIVVDAERIERVLFNLVDNAIKFTPALGGVRVTVRSLKNGQLLVRVIDSGAGIPQEFRTVLFDRFQQLDEQFARRRGTGLGLTYCKLTVEAHGGQIWIEDNPDGGSIFAFTLPIEER